MAARMGKTVNDLVKPSGQVPTITAMPSVWRGGELTDLVERFGNVIVDVESRSGAIMSVPLASYVQEASSMPPSEWYLRDLSLDGPLAAVARYIDAPPCTQNWLESLPETLRPNWTWIFIGPKGTGSEFHIDTCGTAAWNYLIEGEKLWTFRQVSAHGAVTDTEILQRAGDVVFTPSGWLHRVENNMLSFAVTANYVNEANIDYVIRFLRGTGEYDLAALVERVGINRGGRD